MTFKIVAFLFLLTGFGQAATSLVFSGVGYISQNKSWIISEETGFTAQVSNYQSIISFQFENNSQTGLSWSFIISAAQGKTLATGIYTGVERAGFNTGIHPGLDVSGDGRGSTVVDGYFQVFELEYYPVGSVSKLAADFHQISKSSGIDTVTGSIRHNSNIPVPEPSATLLCLIGLGFVARRKR